jgi:hypothetical protein
MIPAPTEVAGEAEGDDSLSVRVSYAAVTAADFEELAALRIAAMREGLERWAGSFLSERGSACGGRSSLSLRG